MVPNLLNKARLYFPYFGAFLFSLTSTDLWALQMVRGPYLQSGTSESLIIRWRTDSATTSRVKYGPFPVQLEDSVVLSREKTDHEVTLTNLEPGTLYYYAVGNAEEFLAGPDTEHYFQTAPRPGVSDSVRVWLIGDGGTANANAKAVRDAYYAFTGDKRTNLWIMLGDNAYNTGTDAEYQTAVFEVYQKMLRTVPLWSTFGNHDGYTANAVLQTGPYFDIFSFPKNGEAGGVPSGTEAYYSHDYGPIHFVNLNSDQISRSPDGEMMQWLRSDLEANDKEWIIAYWHHPPYSKGSHDSDFETQLVEMRANFLPVLEDYGVDLVFSGHSHSYERSKLLDGQYGFSGELLADPNLYILDSGDGRPEGDGAYGKALGAHKGTVYIVAGSSGKISGGRLNHPAMQLSLNELGSFVLNIHRNQLEAKFINDRGEIRDWFTLIKGKSLELDNRLLLFESLPGGSTPPGKAVTIENPPADELPGLTATSNADWLQAVPRIRDGKWILTNTANPSRLPVGLHHAVVTLDDSSIVPARYEVTLSILRGGRFIHPSTSIQYKEFSIRFSPARHIDVHVKEPGDFQVELLTPFGTTLAKKHGVGPLSFTLEGKSLLPGIYFIKVKMSDGEKTGWIKLLSP